MAYSRVQSQTGSVGGAIAASVAITSSATGSGNLLVAFVTVAAAAVTITPPAGWSQVGTTQGSSTATASFALFYRPNSTAGVTSHTFSFSASCNAAVAFEEWSGVLTTSPLDQFVASQNAKATAAPTGTTAALAASGELAIWGLGISAATTLTYSGVTNGYVEDTLANAVSSLASEAEATLFYNTSVGAAATSSAATMSGTGGIGNTTILAVFKPAPVVTPVLATSPATLSFTAVTGGSSPASQNDTLSETAGVGTAWTSAISYGSGAGWLALSPTTGTLSASGTQVLALTCTTGALAAGTYTATVTLTATTGGATATIGVTFTVTTGAAVLASSPSTLAFAATAGGASPATQNNILSNTGSVSSAWTSAISYGTGTGWLALAPTSGTLGAGANVTIGVTCTTGVLTAGTYSATITYTATTGGATATLGVTFVVSTPGSTAPPSVSPIAYSWSDGTPDGSVTSTTTESDAAGLGRGFSFSVPAPTTPRVLSVYVTATQAQGKLTATLSDGSAPAYTDVSLVSPAGGATAVTCYSFTYAAASAGQTLTVTWTMLTDNGSAPVTTYSADTFTRPNQSNWGSSTSGAETWLQQVVSGTAAWNILSNQGQISATVAAKTNTLLGTQTQADVETLGRFSLSNVAQDSAAMVSRYTPTATSPGTNYRLTVSGGTLLQVVRFTAGVTTALSPAVAVSYANNTAYWLKFRTVGSTLLGKLWVDNGLGSSNNEPTVWTLSTSDTSASAVSNAGQYGVHAELAAGDSLLFDTFSATSIPGTGGTTPGTVSLAAATLSPTGVVPSGAQALDVGARLIVQDASSIGGAAPIYKTQLVKAYTAAGVFIDVIRDAPLLIGFKEAVNTATSPLQVVLPRRFDNFDIGGGGGPGTVAQGNIWKYYLFGVGLPATGKLRYQGVVDAFSPSIDATGAETVTVTLVPQSSAIADHGIGGTQAFVNSDPVALFTWWFTNTDPITGVSYTNPLTLSSTNPTTSGVSVSYPFSNQTLASIFGTIIQMLPPNWFFRCNVDNSVTLGITPATAQHTFYLGQDCALLDYKQDWTNLKNVIYLKGGTPAGFGPETITPIDSAGTGNGLFNAVFHNSHTGVWNITVDPSYVIQAKGPAISSGTQTVTPSSMTNIVDGVLLLVSGGSGTAETVRVSAVTSGTFTATFANAHSGAYSIRLSPTFVVNTTASQQVAPGFDAFFPANTTNVLNGAKYLVGGGTNQQELVSVATGSDFTQFGERMALITDGRVADQHTLDVLAQGYLALLDQVVIRTRVRIVDYRGDSQTGLGFDIETIACGDSCRIINPVFPAAAQASSLWNQAVWDSSSWDFAPGTAFGQVAVITALTYGFDYVDLEISTLQPNQDAVLMKLRNTLQDFTLVAQ